MGRKPERKSPKPAAASSAGAAAAASPWVLGPLRDSLLFIGAPLLVMAVFLPLRGLLTSREIAIFLLAFFTFGHHFPTFLRAYGDHELMERFRWRFLLAPPLVFAAALWFDANQLHGLLVFVALWDIWHVLMQHYGFMRIYDSKAGAVNPTGSWLDWALSISWYIALIAVSPHYSHNLLDRAYRVGMPVLSSGSVDALRTGLMAIAALCTLAWLGWHLDQWRRARPVSWRKMALLAIFLGATWYLYVGLDDFLVGFTVWSAFHCIQYYGIVWVYNNNRVNKRAPVAGFTRFLFRPGALLVVLYAALILAYGSINYFASAVPDQFFRRLLIAFIATSNAMHYYFDGFIWKIRDARTRADLQIADASSGASGNVKAWLARMSPSDKGWLQAAAIAAVLLVFAATERARSADDLATAQSLAAAAPELGEAQYNLGTALWARGRIDDAIAAFERAAQKLPESSKVLNNWGGALYDLGKPEEAIERFERALALTEGESSGEMTSASPLMPGDAASTAARPSVIEENMGRALARLGRPEEAVERYRRSLELDPNSASARAGLGVALASAQQWERGAEELRRALEIDPNHASAHINLAGILAYQGREDEAVRHYRAALATGDASARQAAAAGLASLEASPR